ncbi:MAG: LamG domain-containing protein [Phycisphaerales bacterium]|nr:LamG domain-containing protein [Phycisphaerales bacterium]
MTQKKNMIVGVLAACGLAAGASAQMPIEWWSFDTDFSNAGTQGSVAVPVQTVPGNLSITSEPGEFIRGGGALKVIHTAGGADFLDVSRPGGIFPQRDPNIAGDTAAWTVSVWYRYDDTIGDVDTRNFIFETKPNWAVGLGARTAGGRTDMEWFLQNVAQNTEGPFIDDGQWHHAALVYDETDTGTLSYFHNGEFYDVQPLNLSTFFADGSSQDAGMNIADFRSGSGGRNWTGFIDDFAIWDTALSPNQIRALYEGDFNGTPIRPDNVMTVVPRNMGEFLAQLEYEPVIEEPQWSLVRTISFDGPSGLAYDSQNDILYAARRFQGADTDGMTGLDGLYRIDRAGNITQIAGGDRPAGVTIEPGGNAVWWAEDYGRDLSQYGLQISNGSILRTDLTTMETGVGSWGYDPAGADIDPMSIAFVPQDFNNASFSLNSRGERFVRPGNAVSVDRGSGGFDEVYVFDPSQPPVRVAIDDNGQSEFDDVLIFDGSTQNGNGVNYELLPDGSLNSPLVNPGAIAICADAVWVADEGLAIGGIIWKITDVDTLASLPLSQAIAPIALVIDPVTNDLIVLDRSLERGESRVVRINKTTGEVTDIITNIGGYINNNWGWEAIAISDDGSKLFLSDPLGRQIFEFSTDGPTCPPDINGDGVVDADDFFLFLSFFASGDPRADFNNDGVIDADDFFAFLSAFAAGC